MTSTLYMTHDADLPSTAGHYASLIRQPTTVTSQEPVAGAPKAPQPPSGDLGRQAVMDVTASFHERFRDAIIAEGLSPPEDLIADGNLHRFKDSDQHSGKAGWYVLHSDGIPAGAFGSWRRSVSRSWCAKSADSMTEVERQAYRARMDAAKAARDADVQSRHAEVSRYAQQTWTTAVPVPPDHPYLQAKGVLPHWLKVHDGNLLVPMRDTDGKTWSLQTIAPNGDKRYWPGGRKRGCYYSIGQPNGTMVVCEGFATGASIHEATGYAVAIAFDAGNLQAVAKALHAKYPEQRLVLAADDDWKTDGNPGLAKAQAAAQAVGGYVVTPKFPQDRPDNATDFNDLHQLVGEDAVRQCFDAALSAPAAELHASNGWDEPVPLPDGLPPVAPFEAELLPQALRGWVMDIAERTQCPPDFVAVGALVSLSSLIGARHVVAPKRHDDWRVVPNLWGVIIGRPGVMKSPALNQSRAPLEKLEAQAREAWQLAHEDWEVEAKVSAMTAEANEKKAKALVEKEPDKARELLRKVASEPAPTQRRFIVNDSSMEELAKMLTDNPWGLQVYRDEVHALLISMDRPGQEGSRGFYLTGYDGNQGYAVDRISRPSHYVPRVCMALLGAIQPSKMQAYVREAVSGGTGDDGLLQRFGLAVWPDVTREFQLVDRWPDSAAREEAWKVFERLSKLQPANDSEPVEWRFSPDAQAMFAEWLVPFETEIRGDDLHPALVSHLAKYRKLVPALALLFALVDTPEAGAIGVRELARALDWADYLRTHAERLYAAAVTPETGGARLLLQRIQTAKLVDANGVIPDSFRPWEVAVKHWTGLSTANAVRKAADVLVEYGWLKRETVRAGAAGGRPSERYLIHPVLQSGGRRGQVA